MDLLCETERTRLLLAPADEPLPVSFRLKVFATSPAEASDQTAPEQLVSGVLINVVGKSLNALQPGQGYVLRIGETDMPIEVTNQDGSFVRVNGA